MRRRLMHAVAGVLAVVLWLPGPVGVAHADSDGTGHGPVVRLDGGLVRGVAPGDVYDFMGVPFAAPPVGDLRWRAPRPAQPWTGVRDASTPGQPCPQKGRPGGPPVVGSEDCLYLNVTVPARPTGQERLPVMVWFHGGGFSGGAGAQYDPTRLVEQGGVIVVTANYRLGALGFLDLPALARQDPYAGNYGLADQQAALRWVRRNAAAFGGDPSNVTIFGQSAGGFSVCAHLAAPASRGLFQRAIVQSGPCGNALLTSDVAEQHGTTVAANLGCAAPGTSPAGQLTCLHTVPATDLVGVSVPSAFTAAGLATPTWAFVAGTPAVPRQPLDALRSGTAARVPLIEGGTHDEMRQAAAGRNGLTRTEGNTV